MPPIGVPPIGSVDCSSVKIPETGYALIFQMSVNLAEEDEIESDKFKSLFQIVGRKNVLDSPNRSRLSEQFWPIIAGQKCSLTGLLRVTRCPDRYNYKFVMTVSLHLDRLHRNYSFNEKSRMKYRNNWVPTSPVF